MKFIKKKTYAVIIASHQPVQGNGVVDLPVLLLLFKALCQRSCCLASTLEERLTLWEGYVGAVDFMRSDP